MRLKPRLNPNVNNYWMCDDGRYNYHFIDENRIVTPQYKNDLISWMEAIEKIAQAIKAVKDANRIGVLASAQLTNEDLFAVRKLFKDSLKTSNVDFRVPQQSGKSDDFLIKADKNPNTAGAMAILGSQGADVSQIIEKARKGELDILYVFGHDLVKLFGKDAVSQIAKNVKLFVYQGSNINETCSYAHLNLPSAVYAEKDGTFTNCQQRVQRISSAFMPLGEAKADWEILAMISENLGNPHMYRKAQDLFKDLVAHNAAFAEMTYEKIADQGMILQK